MRALSTKDGAELWSVKPPASDPLVVGLVPGDRVVVIETGRCIPSPSGAVLATGARVVDVNTGRELWAVPIDDNFQDPAIVVSSDTVVIGATDGSVSAYEAATGVLRWTRARPPGCSSMTGGGAMVSLAADHDQLVASFRCQPGLLFQRLAADSGKTMWEWVGPSPTEGNGVSLHVTATARQGNVVLITGGIFPTARPFASSLPNAMDWPAELGPVSDGALVVALDAGTGKPRWSERGGQLQDFVLSDGAVCESVPAGLGCRDDVTGLPTRPLLLSGKAGSLRPPYGSDRFAAIAGPRIAVATSDGGAGHLVIGISSVRSANVVARIDLSDVAAPYGCASCQSFVVGGRAVPGEPTLWLVRRIDVAGYPVDVLSTAS